MKLKKYLLTGQYFNNKVCFIFEDTITTKPELWMPIEPGEVTIYDVDDYKMGLLDSVYDIGNWFLRLEAYNIKDAREQALDMVEAQLRCQ